MQNGYYNAKDLTASGIPTTDHKVKVKFANGVPFAVRVPHNTPEALYVENGIAHLLDEKSCNDFVLRDIPEGSIWRQVVIHHSWPHWAQFRIDYKIKAWPCDWEKYTQFYSNKEQAQAFLHSQYEWTSLEDNYFEVISIQEWDWGPVNIDETKWRWES